MGKINFEDLGQEELLSWWLYYQLDNLPIITPETLGEQVTSFYASERRNVIEVLEMEYDHD